MREVLASRIGGQLWTVRFENRRAVQIGFSCGQDDLQVGAVHRGHLLEERPELDAYLVDLGVGKALLPRRQWDRRPDGPRATIFEIDRAARGKKLPRVTVAPRHVGPHLVYLPHGEGVALSKRIAGAANRDPLRAILSSIAAARPGGWVARTAAAEVDESALRAEANALFEDWDGLPDEPLVRSAPSQVERCLRDVAVDEPVVFDDPTDVQNARDITARWGGARADNVRLRTDPVPQFVTHEFADVVRRALASTVGTAHGLSLEIEPTEALVAVDVNRGSLAGRDLQMAQIDAMGEIARQLGLRDLAGAVVIDLIGDDDRDERIAGALRDALGAQRSRTRVLAVDTMGLLRATRERRERAWWDRGHGYWRTDDGCRRETGRDLLDAATALLLLEGRRDDQESLELTGSAPVLRHIRCAIDHASEDWRLRTLKHSRRFKALDQARVRLSSR